MEAVDWLIVAGVIAIVVIAWSLLRDQTVRSAPQVQTKFEMPRTYP
ncbi:MAG: hypothetical protein V1817_01045 [Candidatus Micrarchaeota archaeon]